MTEEYLGDDLVPEKEIPARIAQWEVNEAVWLKDSRRVASKQKLSPKFELGMRVKFTKQTGCNLVGDYGEVMSSRYISSEDWSGFVYQLSNEHLSEPIEIGETWLELISSTTIASC